MRYSTGFSILALVLTAVIFPVSPVAALILLTLVSCALATPACSLRVTTLSVPELLPKVLAAFKTMLFDMVGLTTDFSSNTAVKGDVITGHISVLPSLADYDATTGFAGGATAADNLLLDVPITLNRLKHVPVKIPWLTQAGSKVNLVPPEENLAYVLVKYILDDIIAQSLTNVSSTFQTSIGSIGLDSLESLRGVCNTQKLGNPRHLILNEPLAGVLGEDERLLSKLYYDQRNGDQGLRRWINVAGFKSISTYPDWPVGSYGGLALDRRLVCLGVRAIADMQQIAKALGVPEVMSFDKATDAESGLTLTGVSYEEPGTGNVLLSLAILYGLHVGNGGGSALDKTDLAGLLLKN